MRARENLGPVLASAEAHRSGSNFSVCALLFLSFLLFIWVRLPLFLELTLFVLTSLRFGHFIHRMFVLWHERNILQRLWEESKLRCWTYALGDLEVFLLLIVITVLWYIFGIFQCRDDENCYFSGITFICCVIVGFFVHHTKRLNRVDKKQIAEMYDLAVGYGIAYLYYKNYLVIIKEEFLRRVLKFSTDHDVPVNEKLFILVPDSCKVKCFIDNNINEIMRARELEPLRINVAGIQEREYNITLYELLGRGDMPLFAVEYAQPLKQLYDLFNEGWITEADLQEERTAFMCSLNKFLHDDSDSFRIFILVPHHDGDAISEVLLAANKS